MSGILKDNFSKKIFAPALREILIACAGPGVLKTADGTSSYDVVAADLREAASAVKAYVKDRDPAPVSVSVGDAGSFVFEPLDGRHAAGTMAGKAIVVTGGAQGFGEGLVRGFSERGAYVAVADMNLDKAGALAEELNAAGAPGAIAVAVNVADGESVREMTESVVAAFGGIDVMIPNAGIALAGSLDDMTVETMDKVTAVNYTGYFLCAKYASKVMKIQRAQAPHKMYDIIAISSKSGLVGSKANFAYAGSKFGGIGLTQSFALELAPYGIKVNAICPGNLFDGPLWSDPERGLFVQYLEAGKVPGAKDPADVRRHYEAMIPLGRGCTTDDVMRAAEYIVLQQYETGQAVPVTGGQVMLS
jgi:NAD(P)-dependent dehydrogenase (short-subunit alcohol dehydrogenase family)